MATAEKKAGATKVVLGQPSWKLSSTDVEAYVTKTGGMLAPVTFDRRGKKISPFSVAPWAQENHGPKTPALIRALRGDFFCLPFGANAKPFRGEQHPYHGETAHRDWTFESLTKASGECTLHLSLRTKIRTGRIDKTITVIDGHPAVYSRHIVSEMSGPMDLGHHAMLKFPDNPGSGLISTSKFVYGQVYPGEFEKAADGGYSSLKAGAMFTDLAKVPSMLGHDADLTRYPARQGYEDLVMVVSDRKDPIAWTAVSFPQERYVWFALKDPEVLASTILWISNNGRHYAPWNGRHGAVVGLEEITGNFHDGLSASVAPNPVSNAGHPTTVKLDPRHPLAVNYIMACLPTPAGFDAVKSITPDATGDSVTVKSNSGKSVEVPLDVRFLHGGAAIV